jgi:2-polyprenyl-3-methyl-5-hydroxy-6-metoxy-1,4-benzoquinol methylase
MTRHTGTLAPGYFEALYARDSDPWRFASSEYEREKYARTLAALPAARYANALEIGCSIGVFTEQLAPRCERLLAIDAAEAPLVEAARRCRAQANVAFARMFVPSEWPQGTFDLVLLSEVLYYLQARDVAALADRVSGALAPRASAVLVHWTGETNYPLTADQATEAFLARLQDQVEVVRCERRSEYRLDVLVRR